MAIQMQLMQFLRLLLMMAHLQWPILSLCLINKLASMRLFSLVQRFISAAVLLGAIFLSACTTTPPPPVVSSYSPTAGFDPLTAPIANSIAVPYLSFLIIEPDALAKDGIPPQIEKLVRAKQFKAAVDQIDLTLIKNPRNVQLRFLKARLQIELHNIPAAKKTFTEITQQFPELPEPYNNLAAIGASQDQWIDARDYLELALKLRPDYVTALSNSGDIYIRLAAKNYEAAAKLQPNIRENARRNKALQEILKPPVVKVPQAAAAAKPATTPTTSVAPATSPSVTAAPVTSTPNLLESTPSNGQSSSQNK